METVDTSFVRNLVVVTVEGANHQFMERKVVLRDKLKTYASEAVATYGSGITVCYNKAYICFDGSIGAGEYLGIVDIESLLIE
jgi:hypothetical protein